MKVLLAQPRGFCAGVVRAIEIVLKESELKDAPDYCPEAALWTYAVHHCGYVQSRHATGRTLATA